MCRERIQHETFGELFKKYRLRAEFISLSTFADALAEKGYIYDLSVFSLWQKGKRVPRKRATLISLVAIFIERGAICTMQEANEFLESAEHGYLTKNEQSLLLEGNFQNDPH